MLRPQSGRLKVEPALFMWLPIRRALICIFLACLALLEPAQYFYQNDTDISAIGRRH
jgi:hypothetical protein